METPSNRVGSVIPSASETRVNDLLNFFQQLSTSVTKTIAFHSEKGEILSSSLAVIGGEKDEAFLKLIERIVEEDEIVAMINSFNEHSQPLKLSLENELAPSFDGFGAIITTLQKTFARIEKGSKSYMSAITSASGAARKKREQKPLRKRNSFRHCYTTRNIQGAIAWFGHFMMTILSVILIFKRVCEFPNSKLTMIFFLTTNVLTLLVFGICMLARIKQLIFYYLLLFHAAVLLAFYCLKYLENANPQLINDSDTGVVTEILSCLEPINFSACELILWILLTSLIFVELFDSLINRYQLRR